MEPIRCKATSKRSGVRCQKWAMKGQLVCYMHGGNTPAALEKAEAVQVREQLAKLGLATDAEPHVALLEAIREAHGNVEYYRELVSDMDTRTQPLVKAYNEERDRLVNFIRVGLTLGLAKAQLEAETSEVVIAWAD